jgi:hypothetical protein
MERLGQENKSQQESVTEINAIALESLRAKFDDAISVGSSTERVAALEKIITECSAPLHALEAGVDLSPEYSAYLEALTKMHMLEEARVKLEKLLQSAS